MKLVECVPNFSEGVRKEVVDEIAKSIASCGVEIFDVEMNPVHNRSVITFVGSIDKVFEAAFQGAKTAVKLIDLNKHKGEHPRMGACDVVPIVPMNASTEDCKELAERIGKGSQKSLKSLSIFMKKTQGFQREKSLRK
jgi:Glutamate formiminotransferase